MKKKRVALHMIEQQPSLEGLLGTYNTARYGGHYILHLAELVAAPGQTQELAGPLVRVPRERVAWIQEL